MIAQAVAVREAVRRLQTLRDLDRVTLFRRAGFEPDPWQTDVLTSEARQLVMLCCRQSGKSTVSASLAVSEVLRRPGALALLVAPTRDQSQELLRKVKAMLDALGEDVPAPSDESLLRVEFASGSRILALPGREASVRGFSAPDLVIEDEAALCPDELYMALRPMLAVSAGRMVLLSTPRGKRGHFHREWTEGGPDWHRTKITAYDIPRISREWLEAERLAIGSWWFEQEFLCMFKESEDAFFRQEDIDAMFDSTRPALFTSLEDLANGAA